MINVTTGRQGICGDFLAIPPCSAVEIRKSQGLPRGGTNGGMR
jgi:hypothetical protein